MTLSQELNGRSHTGRGKKQNDNNKNPGIFELS